MESAKLNRILNYFIATVWLVNGLLCKVLNLVPRHQEIVGEILGAENARIFTVLIGLSEVVMAIWIVSRCRSQLNAVAQIVIILTMNIMEFILVPNLLLWGKVNSLFALIFVALIYYNEFVDNKQVK